jgi:hypothetical protein
MRIYIVCEYLGEPKGVFTKLRDAGLCESEDIDKRWITQWEIVNGIGEAVADSRYEVLPRGD